MKEEHIKIKCFAVTDITINEKNFLGIPVRQIEDVKLDVEDTLIIIAVKYIWSADVQSKVEENGFIHFICPPEEIDFFAREESDEVHRPVMEISVQSGCRINCKYCPQELFLRSYYRDGHETRHLSLKNYKKCLDKLPKNTIISFCGFVEPFLNPETVDMIEYTWKMGYDIKLYTTLVGLTKEGFEKIRNIPFHYVVLHTPDEHEYARIPMTEEYFEILDMALEQRKPNGTHFIDTANCQGIPHKKVLAHTMGKLRIMSELYDRAGNLEKDDCLKSVENIKGPIYCTRVNEQLNNNVMLPDGTVVLCNFDFGLKHVLGNLLLQTYDGIMNGEEMGRIKYALDHDSCELLCRNCNFAVNME